MMAEICMEGVTLKKSALNFMLQAFYETFFGGCDSEERPIVVAFLTSFLGPRLHLDFSVPIRL
jgi:hypothetical protein